VVTNALGIDGIEGARIGEHYVAAETDDEFADAILGLWSRPEEAARISRAARELMCTRLSWERAAQLYFGHLRALSLQHGRPRAVHHA
jgi:glycosyltransferase involved in cell wall biosynthesis